MRAFAHSLLLISTLFILAACGGGESLERSDTGTNATGSNTGTTGGTDEQETDPVYSVLVDTKNSAGEDDKNLTQDNVLTISASVTDENGNPKSDTLITFSLSDDNLASFGNDTGTARTDENGLASITLSVGSAAGDGTITATTADGEVGTTTFSSTGTAQISAKPDSLNLYTDKVQLPSSGSDSAQLTALVKNAQSVLMEGQNVAFSAPGESGVEIQVDQAQTDASGRALATLTTRNNAQNRTVQITATVGELTQTLEVAITGTEVTVNGPKSVILSQPAEMTLRVQDSDGVPLANQSIDVVAEHGELSQKSDNPEFASAMSVTTESNGQVTVLYQGVKSGEDAIKASALNANTEFKLTVQEDDFAFVNLPVKDIPLNTQQPMTILWSKENSPFAGGNVTFTTSRGIISAADDNTDANGSARFTIESNNAGLAAITATGVDSDGEEVTAQVQIEFVATEPATVQADATPDILGPDGQTSTITAIVRDIRGNLVKDATVSFVVDDVSTGSISPSQSTTDSNGVASTVFTSGSVTSEDSVVVTASINSSLEDTVVLTVANRPFDIVIGTGNRIESPDTTTYLKRFSVFVTDSAGRPIQGESLNVTATPIKYSENGKFYKGGWEWDDSLSKWKLSASYTACPNEDLNGNGNLDANEEFKEDGKQVVGNGDGMLTPGNVGSVTFDGEGVTDENGQAVIEYRYPKQYGAFAEVEISVFARSTRSEAMAYTRYKLGVASEDLSSKDSPPPYSPFGLSNNCLDTL